MDLVATRSSYCTESRHRGTTADSWIMCKLSCRVVSGVVLLVAVAVGFISVQPRPVFKDSPHPQHNDWSGGLRLAAGAAGPDATTPEPFQIHVEAAVLDDLQARLQAARLPRGRVSTVYGEDSWHGGVNAAALARVIAHWREKYDWRSVEARLNANLPQFTTRVAGLRLHFVHAQGASTGPQGQRCDVQPLLLLHGWPGSIVEFERVIPELTGCRVDGGVSLSVVAPSMPGYGWSDAPLVPGLDTVEIARMYLKLMSALQYDTFFVQGGDWGGMVGQNVAQLAPSRVLGLHVNFLPSFPPPVLGMLAAVAPRAVLGVDAPQMSPLSGWVRHMVDQTGYFHEQSTRPNTVGTALFASPVSLCAWHLEKFQEWSDVGNNIFDAYTEDDLITHIMVYWVTDAMYTSVRLYHESMTSANFWAASRSAILVPTAYADFPAEAARTPETFLRSVAPNLMQYTRMTRGGHFAAVEEPKALADDVLRFVSALNSGVGQQ